MPRVRGDHAPIISCGLRSGVAKDRHELVHCPVLCVETDFRLNAGLFRSLRAYLCIFQVLVKEGVFQFIHRVHRWGVLHAVPQFNVRRDVGLAVGVGYRCRRCRNGCVLRLRRSRPHPCQLPNHARRAGTSEERSAHRARVQVGQNRRQRRCGWRRKRVPVRDYVERVGPRGTKRKRPNRFGTCPHGRRDRDKGRGILNGGLYGSDSSSYSGRPTCAMFIHTFRRGGRMGISRIRRSNGRRRHASARGCLRLSPVSPCVGE